MSEDERHAGADPEGSPPAPTRWARWLSWRNIAILIVAAAMLHAAGFCWLLARSRHDASAGAESLEVTLGRFRAAALGAPDAGQAPEFQLHLELLEVHQDRARALLARHQFRVQQGIEELLRQLRPDDFDDPQLTRLKLRIQETVNRALGLRAVGEVLITDLGPTGQRPKGEATATAPRELDDPPAPASRPNL